MKKIIKGKLYNTDTAKKLNMRWTGAEYNRTGWEELYRKKTGEFFILAHRYSGQTEDIIPLTYDEATRWAEKYLSGEEHEEIFGEIVDNGSRVHLHASVSASDMKRIQTAAAKAGLTVSAYIVQRCAK